MNNIFKKLQQLQKHAYCNYSNYPVACVIISQDQKQYYGVNVENASIGLTICAERNAIANMITNGSNKIQEIHILCGPETSTDYASACGACRQVISEFILKDGLIYLWNHDQTYKCYRIEQYLPDYFSNTYLKGGC